MNADIRVLLIEDDPDDAFLATEALADADDATFTVTRVDKLQAAISLLLGEHDIDVVLLDLTLPDSSGIDTFIDLYTSRVRLPIIVLTGLHDDVLAGRMFRLGAQGYLVKGVDNLSLLPNAIRYGLEQFAIQVEAERRTRQEQHTQLSRDLRALWPDEASVPCPETGERSPLVAAYRAIIERIVTGTTTAADPALEPIADACAAAHLTAHQVADLHITALSTFVGTDVDIAGWGYGPEGYLLLIRLYGLLLTRAQAPAVVDETR
jgi:DNA-binding response OmpR family regulator